MAKLKQAAVEMLGEGPEAAKKMTRLINPQEENRGDVFLVGENEMVNPPVGGGGGVGKIGVGKGRSRKK